MTLEKWGRKAWRLSLLAGLVASSGLLSSCSGASGDSGKQVVPSEPVTITVGNATSTISAPYVLWAIEQGFFDEEGLEVVPTPGGSTVDRVAAITGGSADMVALDAVTFLTSQVNGSFDGRVVGSLYGVYEEEIDRALELPPYDGDLVLESVFALQPGMTLQDLSVVPQPRIAYRSPTSSATLGLKAFLETEAFDSEAVEWVSLSSVDDRLNALLAGEVDGAILSGGHGHQALQAGATLAAYPTAHWLEPGPNMMWVATRERAEKDPESFERFQRVMYRVAQEINSGENLDEFKQMLVREFELSPEALDQLVIPRLSVQSYGPQDFEYFGPKMVDAEIVEKVPSLGEDAFLEALISK